MYFYALGPLWLNILDLFDILICLLFSQDMNEILCFG